jgi:hypothetical protein
VNDCAHFFVAPSRQDSGCALCVVQRQIGQRPIVTVYFPSPVYQQLQEGLPSLRSDTRGTWMVGSTQTSVSKIRRWLQQYEAWDMVVGAETVVFGDKWQTDDWRYFLARAS